MQIYLGSLYFYLNLRLSEISHIKLLQKEHERLSLQLVPSHLQSLAEEYWVTASFWHPLSVLTVLPNQSEGGHGWSCGDGPSQITLWGHSCLAMP